jgi:hypothetical protein
VRSSIYGGATLGKDHAQTMGATASRSEKKLKLHIESFETSLHLSKRPIMWEDDSSVTAHSALNTLRNAQYHIQSGRRGRGLQAAATSKLICTGRLASPTAVSFDALAVDINSRQSVSVKVSCPLRRVRTGQCAPVAATMEEPAYDVMLRRVRTGQCAPVTATMEEPACDVIHCSAIRRSPSSSSSMCSLDDTWPRSADTIDSAPAGQVQPAVDACGAPAAQICHFEQASGEAFDFCEILTRGGRCQTSDRPARYKAQNYSLDDSMQTRAFHPSRSAG